MPGAHSCHEPCPRPALPVRKLATIDFSAHLRELTALIIRGQSNAPERIRLVVESDPVEVNLDTAIRSV